MASLRTLVLKSPGFAGLGDLLLALERALLVARATDRSLVIDWRDSPYSRGERNLAEQLFELVRVEQLPTTELAKASGSVLPPTWLGKLDQPLRQVYGSLRSDNWNRGWASNQLDAGLSALDSDAAWVVLWDHSASALSMVSLRRLGIPEPPPLQQHLQLRSALQEVISIFQGQHFRQPMVGVHLRASAEAVRAGKSAALDNVYQRIDQLLNAHPDSGLFLASDNAATIAALRARYPAVLTRPKWLPATDAPLHLNEDSETSGIAIASDALIELALLASCDHLIHPALSSFSLAAARWAGLSSTRLHPIEPPPPVPRQQWSWPAAGWIYRDQMAAIPAEENSDQAALVSQPAVSVLMLAFNHAPWLQQAVESVMLQQLDEPFELLIGEDRSSDHTLELALNLQQRWHHRIRVIHAPRNVGIRDNVLRLLVRARAPLVAFLEGDDHWVCPTKLQQQLSLLRADRSLSCVASLTQNRPATLPPRHHNRFQLPDLLRRYPVHSSSLMFRTELAIPYPNFPEGALDTMLLALLTAKGDCGMIRESLSYYRRHPGGYWTGAERSERLRLSRECIDALDAFFFQRFRRELTERELWIHRLDAALPAQQTWWHWRQTWRLQLSQAPRLLRRDPLGYMLLIGYTALVPLLFELQGLRNQLALGSRLRRLRASLLR